jgi:hypothetical protein
MKYLFGLFLLVNTLSVQAQLSDKEMQSLHDKVKQFDSSSTQLDSSMMRSLRVTDSINNVMDMERNNRNLDALVSEMKERNDKEKRQLWLRFGFVGLLLVMAVIGFLRRRKVADKGSK